MIATSLAPSRLIGRAAELELLFDLVDGVRKADLPRTLVVRGEPGIGKTSLLAAARDHATDSGVHVLSTAGVQAEADLPFSALHQLLLPVLDGVDHLPERQRDAIGSAFGLGADPMPERFLVGLAVLTLLSEEGEERPLLCTIDDAQWLDPQSAKTLAFVARRLSAESVVLMFAANEPIDELQGLPELTVEGLPDADALELLSSVVPGRLDEAVRDRILAETRGNPLALLELPKGLSPAELAGGFGLPTALPDAGTLSGRIEESFLRRIEVLPADTQLLLLVVATEPVGNPALLRSAAEQLGIRDEALAPAVAADLLEAGVRVRFRHPLVRSAVYRAASPERRRRVHQVLAEATDPDVEPDRRAWHRGQAASALDEDVAAALEQSADRAAAHGGFTAAAAFLERAAELTPDPGRRVERTMAAAQAKHQAGAPDAALKLLALAETGPLDELLRARGERLRAELAFALSRGDDAPPLLLSAARRLEPLDPAVARETYREALAAAITVGRRDTLLEVARAIPADPPSRQPSAEDLLLTGWAELTTEGYPAGMDRLQRALSALRSEDLAGQDAVRELWEFASRTAILLWDDEIWHVLSARHVQLARDTGALTVLPAALAMHAESEVFSGELSSAAALAAEADAVTEANGSARVAEPSLLLAGWRGLEAQGLELIEPVLEEAAELNDDGMITVGEYANSVLNNGLGRYDVALDAAKRSCEHHPRNGFGFVLSEMVEAAARSGEMEFAAGALEQLLERTRLSTTDWARGMEARSRALLSDKTTADELFQEAVQRLSRTRVRTDLARAHLLYGEWLRREGRRREAREQLRIAYEMFTAMDMEAFAGRTERELLAAGEKLRKGRDETHDPLTPQEAQIARLARKGQTNAEIAAQLFLSPRTVEWHLRKVFGKLGISSRMGLHDALPHTEREAELAAEQAALRRVATLVAEGTSADDVFAAVAREIGGLFGVGMVNIDRYENGESVVVASFEDPGFPVGTRWPLDGPGVRALVYETGRPARVDDFTDVAGTAPAAARASGIKSAVAVPIIVDGNVWGALGFGWKEDEPPPPDTEQRLAAFTELVSTAIANAESRGQLASSEALARELAEEQAALRRVATLVASTPESGDFLSTIAREVATVMSVPGVIVQRYEPDETVVTLGAAFDSDLAGAEQFLGVGSRMPRDPGSLAAQVFETHLPARIDDFSTLPGTIGDLARGAGLGSGCAGPIVVNGDLWGKMCVFSRAGVVLPAGTENRLRDFIELVATAIANHEARADLAASEARARELASEQAALRRVATLVAQGASPDELFAAVAKEVAGVIDLPVVGIQRYEADETFTILANAGETSEWVGTRWPVGDETLAGSILATGRPARQDDHTGSADQLDDPVREAMRLSWQETRSVVGVPIIVDGSVWGFLAASAKPGGPIIPAGTEERLERFTGLLGTAIANAEGRAELDASRARIVATADATRRRIERDLHDGAQQQLVGLALALRAAQATVPEELEQHRAELSGVVDGLSGVLDELREIALGIHPAGLSEDGLTPALKRLVARSPLRVNLDVRVEGRFPEPVEVATYYVVAEALTNAAKYAETSLVDVVVSGDGRALRVEVRDEGPGGADPAAGSGLLGLRDRVEAIGGTMHLTSPLEGGTSLTVELPLGDQSLTH